MLQSCRRVTYLQDIQTDRHTFDLKVVAKHVTDTFKRLRTSFDLAWPCYACTAATALVRGLQDFLSGYHARSPTTVGTTRDRPPPWVLSGIAHTVDMRRHRAPRSATVPHVHAPTRPVSQNTLETALLAHTRPERSVVHARSFRNTSQKNKKNGRPSHPSFMGSGVCL